jgi:hypothetical protein
MSQMTLNFSGVDLRIDYDYRPAEKEVRYYSDGSGYPGCPESLEINAVMHKDEDITELCEPLLEKIEEAIYNHWSKRDDY